MSATIITMEDLHSFKTQFIDEIKELLSSKTKSQEKKWLKASEVREMLNISPGTLQTLRINGVLKFSKVGGTIFYDADQINKLLEQSSNKAS